MQLKKLFGMQKNLDKHINEEHKLQGENLIPKKVLAFIVELSELANEIRFFKFWSSKPASHPNIVLEEYVDGLHFLLSIANELEADKKIEEDFKVDYITKGSTTEEFK